MDVDMKYQNDFAFEYDVSSTPKSPSSDEILTMYVPINFKDPFARSAMKRNDEGSKSIVKAMAAIDKHLRPDGNTAMLKSTR